MKEETAILAAGCFWGIQDYFNHVLGVIKTEVGYTGGHTKNPTYEQVCMHTTGHAEAIKITFDPQKISYLGILNHFFYMHDPTLLDRQGPDIGDEYRSAIFYLTEGQKSVAEGLIGQLNNEHRYKKPIVTEVTKASTFYRAEEFHQEFARKHGGIGGCVVSPPTGA